MFVWIEQRDSAFVGSTGLFAPASDALIEEGNIPMHVTRALANEA
jgi:hypothetical protein